MDMNSTLDVDYIKQFSWEESYVDSSGDEFDEPALSESDLLENSHVNENDLESLFEPERAELQKSIKKEKLERELLEIRLKNLSLKKAVSEAEKKNSKMSFSSAKNNIRKTLHCNGINNKKSKIFQDNKEITKIVLDLTRNSKKVPKFNRQMPIMKFLTQDLYNFCLDQGFFELKHVLPWLHHSFEQFEMRMRLNHLVSDIIKDKENIEIIDFLTILGKKLSPKAENFDPSKASRKKNECLQDAVYRLLNLVSTSDLPENVCCQLVVTTLTDYEKDSAIKTEITREILRLKNVYTPDNILLAARTVDKILNLDDLSLSAVQEELLEINAFEDKKKCPICKTNNLGKNKFGFLHKSCWECSKGEDRKRNNFRNCKSCGTRHSDRSPRTNEIFDICKRCFYSNNNYENFSNKKVTFNENTPNKNYDPFSSKNFSSMRNFGELSQSENDKNILVYSPGQDFYAALNSNMEMGVNRLRIKFRTSNGLEADALCDCGANSNVITLTLLKRYNLENQISYPKELTFATSFDGSKVSVVGQIVLPLVTGSKTLKMKFDVVHSLGRFSALLGTPYLAEMGVMKNIEEKLKQSDVIVTSEN